MKASLIWLIIAILSITTSIYYCTLIKIETYCGTIRHKVTVVQAGKYVIYNHPTFIVDFDNGYTKEMGVELITFLDKEKGNRICFNLEKGFFEDKRYEDKAVILMLLGIFILIGIKVFKD